MLTLRFLVFWAILFTGEYPAKALRWQARVNAYMSYLTHHNPPFRDLIRSGGYFFAYS